MFCSCGTEWGTREILNYGQQYGTTYHGITTSTTTYLFFKILYFLKYGNRITDLLPYTCAHACVHEGYHANLLPHAPRLENTAYLCSNCRGITIRMGQVAKLPKWQFDILFRENVVGLAKFSKGEK